MKTEDLYTQGPITIVAFGDSVTHGCLQAGVKNYESVYWNRLRKKLLQIRDEIPINVINAGIDGSSATTSLARMQGQVLQHHPDLLIVCFGLNDIHDPLDEYLHSLDEIFQKANAAGCETIFMSPNMMNTYVADDVDTVYREVAGITAEYQNSGRMDRYIEGALNQADRDHIYICDCYTEWKAMSQTQDTTMLLANRINHPLPELHEIFADKLFATIMKNQL